MFSSSSGDANLLFSKQPLSTKDGKNSMTEVLGAKSIIIIIHLYCNHNDQNTGGGGPNGMDNLWENDWKNFLLPRDWHVFQWQFFHFGEYQPCFGWWAKLAGRSIGTLLRTQISAELRPRCCCMYLVNPSSILIY